MELLLIGMFTWIGVGCLYAGSKRFKRWRRLDADAATTIQEALHTTGAAQIEGTVHAMSDDQVVHPPSQEECLAYEYKLKERHGTDWRHVEQGSDETAFLIQDESGEALVKPADAEFSFENESQTSISDEEDLPDGIPITTTGFRIGDVEVSLGQRQIKYIEGTLEPGETGFVYGDVTQEVTADAATTTVIEAGDAEFFLISDTDLTGTARRLLLHGIAFTLVGLFTVGVVGFVTLQFI